ncbi:hypothetical protein BGZ60DRAFT_528133 [Tricladium varicosporioides]|nr:hypothetical protein BGZ60DRAFT_528133 [Hymenoscyphus varicosporioides]
MGRLPQVSNPDVASRPEAVATGRTEQHLPLGQVNKGITYWPLDRRIFLYRAWGALAETSWAGSILDLWWRIYGELVCARPLNQGPFAPGFWIYAANPRIATGVTKTETHSDAEDLCAKLAAEQSSTKTEDRPIIFIAHSLGGLVAAQVLVHGEQRTNNSSAKSITKNLRGLIFLGTPFRGSSVAKPAEIARRILEVFGVNTQQHTLKLLGVDSKRLDKLTRAFPEVLNKRRTSKNPEYRIEAFFFYKTLKTSFGIRSVQIVEVESAQLPGCGDPAPIRADHIGICKFKTEKDEGYSIIVAAIRKVMLPPNASPLQGTKTIYILGKAVNVTNDSIHIHSQTNNL